MKTVVAFLLLLFWVVTPTASAQQSEPQKLATPPVVITAVPGEIVYANVSIEAIPGEAVVLHVNLLGGIGTFQGVPYHQFAGTSVHSTIPVFATEQAQVFLVEFFVTDTAEPGQKSVGFQYWDQGGQVIELTVDLQIRQSFPQSLALVAHSISGGVLTYTAGPQSIQNFRTKKTAKAVAKIYYRYFDANGWEYDKNQAINSGSDTIVATKGGSKLTIGFKSQYQISPVERRVIVALEKR